MSTLAARSKILIAVATAAVALGVAAAGVRWSGTGSAPDGGFNVGRYQPGDRRAVGAFEGPRLGGGATLGLGDVIGSVAVVNFWGSWCPPCRAEQPRLQRVWEEYHDRGVVFLGIDVRDAESNGLAFVEEFSVTYPSILNPSASLAQVFRVNAMPSTFVLDREGRIAARISGELRSEDDLRRILDEELAR